MKEEKQEIRERENILDKYGMVIMEEFGMLRCFVLSYRKGIDDFIEAYQNGKMWQEIKDVLALSHEKDVDKLYPGIVADVRGQKDSTRSDLPVMLYVCLFRMGEDRDVFMKRDGVELVSISKKIIGDIYGSIKI